jgi:CubicO group peptidase (beta-lactamase class C family)
VPGPPALTLMPMTNLMTGAPETIGAVIASQLAGWPGQAAAGVVARPSSGAAPELVAACGAVDESFDWASVTKLLVSVASMVAVEEGTVGLQDTVGPPGSTLSHLLAHASGLPFEGDRPIAAPAQRRVYSNAGIEVAATHLEEVANMPFDEYLRTGVLEPLGMGETVLDGSPAHSATGPLPDLLALAGELLAPSLVSPETLRAATSVAWPGLAGVLPGFGRHEQCDWGLGPEIRSHKSPHWTGKTNSPQTFGHFGQSGSFLWVDPVAEVAVGALSSTAFGPWAREAWPALSDAVLSAYGRRPAAPAEVVED